MSNETQRELEQRALRNVRGLVDRLEGMEKTDERKQRRILTGIVVAAVVGVAALAAALTFGPLKRSGSATIVIEDRAPAAKPAASTSPR